MIVESLTHPALAGAAHGFLGRRGGVSTGIHAGLSDVVDLAGKGPIQGNSEVVMRIMPLSGRADLPRSFALLRNRALRSVFLLH